MTSLDVEIVEPLNGVYEPGKHYYKVWGDVFEIDEKYIPIKPLGWGTYGMVCLAENIETGEEVAIKKIANIFECPLSAKQLLREIQLMRLMDHHNILGIYDVIKATREDDFNDIYLVSELMDMDLHQIIYSTPLALNDDHCRCFIYQLLSGLKHMHSANVLHRDLKPSNLLVNTNYELKIGDFGLARTCSHDGLHMTTNVGTQWYRAPEMLLDSHDYSGAVDIWSVGCIFAELLGGKPIFPAKNRVDQLKSIINIIGSPKETDLTFIKSPIVCDYIKNLPLTPRVSLASLYLDANPLALELIDRMLTFHPLKRINAIDALEHPYFSDVHDLDLEPSVPTPFEFDFEEKDFTKVAMRELVWEEMLHYSELE